MRRALYLALALAGCTVERDVFVDPVPMADGPSPTPCVDDSQCVFGAAVCNAMHCEACPSISGCPVCPAAWERLERNGCPSCECGPPTKCTPTTVSCVPPTSTCYPGSHCAPGCLPSDAGCCTSECGVPGCPTPAPVGCLETCTPMQASSGCTTCAAEHCDCLNNAWHCTPACANGTQASCIAPM